MSPGLIKPRVQCFLSLVESWAALFRLPGFRLKHLQCLGGWVVVTRDSRVVEGGQTSHPDNHVVVKYKTPEGSQCDLSGVKTGQVSTMEETGSVNGENPLDMDPVLHENFLALIAQHEQVRTLFVSGLPMDAKPRELYLLFRAYKVQSREPNSSSMGDSEEIINSLPLCRSKEAGMGEGRVLESISALFSSWFYSAPLAAPPSSRLSVRRSALGCGNGFPV
ncbi:hypothetical protein RRG08_051924 [Elysia crispata]|uniref:Uncharacterized protein n=1 Tax=Elysia crispata TaxID=231223 RepID=A0AAE0Y1U0_9GAST|nr:hypothetical protein RRG08_051924 [Elysia crispata]